jgi:hypothetical protein
MILFFYWTHRLTVRTLPFHGKNRDSNSLGFTNFMPGWSIGTTGVSKTLKGGSTPSPGAIFIEASSSGRTAGFDPAYRGSNPCASAILVTCRPA